MGSNPTPSARIYSLISMGHLTHLTHFSYPSSVSFSYGEAPSLKLRATCWEKLIR